MAKIFIILLIGPQGSGKGTQAEMLAKRYNLPILAPGDIFRKEIKEQTELGKSVAEMINKGKMVPDEIANKIVFGELGREKYENGFILDGYPRNMNQIASLEKSFSPTHVFELAVDDNVVVKRLSGRRVCPKCGAIYNIENKPPRKEGVCDLCGGKLVTRDDDKPEAIKKRLAIYHQETEPILNYYFEKKKIIRINGEQPIEKVFEDIVDNLRNYESGTKNTKSES